jgi:hypothetical protein
MLSEIANQIAGLEKMQVDQLRGRYVALFGEPPRSSPKA